MVGDSSSSSLVVWRMALSIGPQSGVSDRQPLLPGSERKLAWGPGGVPLAAVGAAPHHVPPLSLILGGPREGGPGGPPKSAPARPPAVQSPGGVGGLRPLS